MKIDNLRQQLSWKRLIWPIIIGIGVASFLVWRDKDGLAQAWQSVISTWSFTATLFILLAIVMVFVRDLAYMYRIRLLTDRKLKWNQCFQDIMLWEFASAITPSVVGGSAVAIFIINQEKISGGRSTAIVMITALLDELFFILMVPCVLMMIHIDTLFSGTHQFEIFGAQIPLFTLFIIGYAFISFLTLFIFFGVFVRPQWFRYLILKLFKLPFLRRFAPKAEQFGNDIITTSSEFRHRSFGFWLKAFGATVFSWTARYAVVNFLILAISPGGDQALIYARQLVMWVVLLISPTPGGSGIAEYAFPLFLGDFIPLGMAPSLAMVWRLLTYYPYLIIGTIVLPIWLRRVRRPSQSLKD